MKAGYTYLSDGTKARALDASGAGYDYLGSFTYTHDANNNTTLESVVFGGGRVRKNGSGYDVDYYITDHLGSVRAIVNASGTITEQNDYYPFGTRHPNGLTTLSGNRWRFSGKEEQDASFGVPYSDFGARLYDRTAWTAIDPLAEKYYAVSPYAYCNNNPVNVVDFDGDKIVFVNGYLGFGSSEGGANYWSSSFVSGAKSFFQDYSTPHYTDVSHGIFSSALNRRDEGYKYAGEKYDSLIADMKEGEPFHLVSHSMGGAFSIGIKDYLEQHGWSVESMVFINTYQSDKIKTENKDHTLIIDYQNTNDPVLFWLDANLGKGRISNSDITIRNVSNRDFKYIHMGPISSGQSFWDELQNILNEY